MKKNATRALWIVLASVALTAAFWSAVSETLVPVRVAEVKLLDPHSGISTNGKVEAARVYEIRASLAGMCRSIAAREGDVLKAGQTILVLDEPGLESDLATARAELAAAEVDAKNTRRGPALEELNTAEAEVSRLRFELETVRKTLRTAEWLLERKAVPSQEVEEGRRAVARAEAALTAATQRRDDIKRRFDDLDTRRAASRVEAARTRVQYLESSLARAIVRAPADGTLYHFEVKDGTYLNAGDPIGNLADLSVLRVRAYVDEPELGRVREGSDVVVRWDARPAETWRGTVTRMPAQVVARGSRSVGEVLASISGARTALIPNVNVDVEIVTASGPTVPALPRTAVFQDTGGQFAWVVRDNQASRRNVETGRSSASLIEITKGLKVGDRVIMLGDNTIIAEGTKVRILEQ